MFPLAEKRVSGFKFGQLYPKSFGSLYNHPHLGTDYHADEGTPLYAPFDGKIVNTLIGTEGGKTIWFKPDNDDVIMRFMHLSSIGRGKGERVMEGKLIGLTGNTGSATNSPHLHLDISKHSVDIYKFSNFLDPEKYQWEKPLSTPIDNKQPFDDKSTLQQIPVIQVNVNKPTDFVGIATQEVNKPTTQNMPPKESVIPPVVSDVLSAPKPTSDGLVKPVGESVLDKVAKVIAKEGKPTLRDRLMAFIQTILDLIRKANSQK